MRTLYLAVIGLFLATSLQAQAELAPQTKAPLYAHLYEINAHWVSQANPVGLMELRQFNSDRDRIQCHLQLVERTLRKRPVDHLSDMQQQLRKAALDHLQSYWQLALFPVNRQRGKRMPIFVDDQHTACAVGYLMLNSGANELVDRIRREDNFASLESLLAYEEVPEWAKMNGFSTEELAWIQPAYAVAYFSPEVFGNDQGLEDGQVWDMQQYGTELYFAGTFSSIDGFSSPFLAAWDGAQFRAFPGLTATSGGFSRISIDENTGTVYGIGTFIFSDNSTVHLFARYGSEGWEHLLEIPEEATSPFSDLICNNGYCYLSGNFSALQGDTTIAHLAVYNLNENSWSRFSEDFTVDGTINDMDTTGDSLLIGGQFALRNGSDTITENAAVLNTANRTFSHEPELQTGFPVQEVKLVNIRREYDSEIHYRILLEDEQGYAFGFLTDGHFGGWFQQIDVVDTNSVFYGIGDYLGLLYGAASLDWIGLDEDPYVLMSTPGESASLYFPIVQANGPVTAAAYFNNELILAGEFTELDGEPIRHLSRADLLISDTDDAYSAEEIVVQTDGKTIFLDYLPIFTETTTFELFDVMGRLIWSVDLPPLESYHALKPEGIPSGTYVYRLQVDETLVVGQLSLVR